MTQAAPQKESQFSIVIIAIILFGISFGVGFAAMVMTAVLFLFVVGGPEWGPMLMIFASPVIGFMMGVGSLMVMGGHAAWWRRGERPFSPAYCFIWILSWVVSLAILFFTFIFSLVVYFSPESSFIWSIPLSLFVGLLVGANLNHRVWIKQTKVA